MDPETFRRLLGPFPDLHLLVAVETGTILATNSATAAVPAPAGGWAGATVPELVLDNPERVLAYLRACAATGSLLPGMLTFPNGTGAGRRCRCDGARLHTESGEPVVLLRIRQHEAAAERFVLLNRKIEELNREVNQRRRAESDLRDQAAQLEELAVELELTIEQLQIQKDEAIAAKHAAEQANRAKSEFLAVMSHELRTPLNAILGNVDLLDAEVRGPLTAEQRSQLERVRHGALHLLGLIEQVLELSRIEAGRARADRIEVDVTRLLEDAAELMRPIAEQRGLKLSTGRVDADCVFETDPRRLNQIVLNLLSNALKFTEQGEVVVECGSRAGELVLAVRDTGIGIASKDLERIFEPFTQLDSSRTRRAGGTGMGLAVSRELAGLIGGTLSVESEPGTGSCFTLRVPAG